MTDTPIGRTANLSSNIKQPKTTAPKGAGSPKIIFNQGERKFVAMDPKDDALVNRIYNSPDPVADVKKLVKDTAPPSDTPFQDILPRLQNKNKKIPVKTRGDMWSVMKASAQQTARETGDYSELRELRQIEKNHRRAMAKSSPRQKLEALKTKPETELPKVDLNIEKMFQLAEEQKRAEQEAKLAEERLNKILNQPDPDLNNGLGYLLNVYGVDK